MSQKNEQKNLFLKVFGSAALAGVLALIALIWSIYSTQSDDLATQQQLSNQATQIAKQDIQISLNVEQNLLLSLQSTLEAERISIENQLRTPVAANDTNFASTATALAIQSSQIEATRAAVDVRQQEIEAVQTSIARLEDESPKNFVLFEEDFENGSSQIDTYWGGGEQVWEIISENTDNKVFDADNRGTSYSYPRIIFGLSTWGNYAVNFRIRILDQTEQWSSANFYFRSDSSFWNYQLSFNAMEDDILLAYSRGNDGWDSLQDRHFRIDTNVWYDVQVIANGDKLQIFVDDVSLLNVTDSHRPTGELHFAPEKGIHMQVDDIQVIELP